MTEVITTPTDLITSQNTTMSVAEWINVPDNPRQRNTPQHSMLATGQNLKKFSDAQKFVVMACMDGKILCKVDGHSRAHLWKTYSLEWPPEGNVHVNVHHVKSMEEAKALYDHYDSPYAVKKPKDFLFSTIREYGFRLDSPLLRPCTFSWQLAILERMSQNHGAPLSATVEKWKRHMIELDELGLSGNYRILVGFMLVAIKYKGIETAGRFLVDLDKDRGTKNSLGRDGIEATRDTIGHRRANNLVNKEIHRKETWEVAWTGFIKWLDGKMIKNNKRLAPNTGMWEVVRPSMGKRNGTATKPTVILPVTTTATEDFTEDFSITDLTEDEES